MEPGRFAVLTLHRPANVDCASQFTSIIGAINEIAERIQVLFPVHPRTALHLKRTPMHPNILITEPMTYLHFLGSIARAKMVLTDSGGIQEETTVLGVPCLTMRPNTERPITCEIGTNILVGTDPARITAAAYTVLDARNKTGRIPEKWDGHAAERIVEVMLAQHDPAAEAQSGDTVIPRL
jgi:UDP-N-acetylglucosamine 2-epimerase (non-hydrolysing)